MVTGALIRGAVRELGLTGKPLCVHASLRSFGWVEGGAATVVEALLAEDCTVLVPTFTYAYAVHPPPDMRPARNGTDYRRLNWPALGAAFIYTPASTVVDRGMGAISALILKLQGHVRGNHPLCPFAAAGPLAHELIAGQQPLDLCAPLQALAAARGDVVLMGVGLETMTLLHLAEKTAGRNLFRRWANGPDGFPMQVETGGCSDGFSHFEELLAPVARGASVGASRWRVYPASQTLAIAAAAIRKHPAITHCLAECERCDDAVAGGPILGPDRSSAPMGEFPVVQGEAPNSGTLND